MTELERDLYGLAGELAWPETPVLADAVGRQLRARARPRLGRRPFALAFAAVLAAVGVGLAVPPARSALFELLRIGGATVERVETRPDAPRVGPQLGREATVGEAREAAAFDLLVPAAEGVRAFVDASVPGARISFAWRERGRALVLTQFRGQQLPYVEKLVGPRTRIVSARVDGAEAVWLDGARHEVIWRDAEGDVRHETRRLAGSVLLWDRNGITFRLEGPRTLEHARAVVRSLS